MDKQYKYRINELLGRVPASSYKKVLRLLPSNLGIKPRTFDYYRAIKLDEPQDIPHAVVDALETFFAIPKGSLQNYETNVRPLAEMESLKESSHLLSKFNLVKS